MIKITAEHADHETAVSVMFTGKSTDVREELMYIPSALLDQYAAALRKAGASDIEIKKMILSVYYDTVAMIRQTFGYIKNGVSPIYCDTDSLQIGGEPNDKNH